MLANVWTREKFSLPKSPSLKLIDDIIQIITASMTMLHRRKLKECQLVYKKEYANWMSIKNKTRTKDSEGCQQKMEQTCSSFSFIYCHIRLITSARGKAFSSIPKNFTRASDNWTGARKPDPPPFCLLSFCFGSSESG